MNIPNPGDQVRIIRISHNNHTFFLGKVGTVKRYIKSRNVVEIITQNQYVPTAETIYGAYPENIEPAYAPVDTGEALPQLTFAPAPDQQLRMF